MATRRYYCGAYKVKDSVLTAFSPAPTFQVEFVSDSGSLHSASAVEMNSGKAYHAYYDLDSENPEIAYFYAHSEDSDTSDVAMTDIHWVELEDLQNDVTTISGSITSIETDLNNPDQYKADVSALALEATLTAIKGSGWTTETLVDIRNAITSGAITSEDVWTYLYRTLTPSGAVSTTEPVLSTTPVDMYTHSSNTITVACVDADEVWFTLKSTKNQLDSAAMLQVSKTGSLLYHNGQSASSAGLSATDATLTISNGYANIFVSGSAAPLLFGEGEKRFTGEVKRRMNSGAMPIVSQFPVDVHVGLTQAL